MCKSFSYILALVSAAMVFTLSSCNKSGDEPEMPIYKYNLWANIQLNMSEGFTPILADDPRHLEMQEDVREIIYFNGEATGLNVQASDTAKIATFVEQYSDYAQAALIALSDSLNAQGITLSGMITVYGGLEDNAERVSLFTKTLGGYTQAGTGVRISYNDAYFIVEGAQGLTGQLYKGSTLVKEISFTSSKVSICCLNYGDGTYMLKVGEKELTHAFSSKPSIHVTPAMNVIFAVGDDVSVFPVVYQ